MCSSCQHFCAQRLLGLGDGRLPLRLLIALLPGLGAIYFPDVAKASGNRWRFALRGTPLSRERFIQRFDLIFINSPWLAFFAMMKGYSIAKIFLVVWAGPNVLRHACIALLSSFSHYYGDVTPGDVSQQNQILVSFCGCAELYNRNLLLAHHSCSRISPLHSALNASLTVAATLVTDAAAVVLLQLWGGACNSPLCESMAIL